MDRLLAWVAFLIFTATFGFSDDQIYLDPLVKEVLIVNPDIKSALDKWKVTKERVVQVGVLEDPMLGVEFEGLPTDTARVGRFQDVEWSFSQSIPFPGKLSLRRKAAEGEAQKAYLEYLEKEREVVRGVKLAYAEYYFIHRKGAILKRNENLLSQFIKITRVKYEIGKAPQSDVLKAQVELAKIQNEILIQVQERETAQAKINMFLSRPSQEFVPDPVEPSSRFNDFPIDILLDLAVKNRPEIQHHASSIDVGQYRLQLAKREYWPNFFAKVEARQFQGEGLEEYDVMLGINIPWLWTRARVESSVEEARFELKAAREDYEAKKLMIFFEIKENHTKVKTAQNLIHLYQTNILPSSKQAVESAEAGYQADKVDFLMLLDGQRSLLEFELESEEAKRDYHKSLAELERSVGIELTGGKNEN